MMAQHKARFVVVTAAEKDAHSAAGHTYTHAMRCESKVSVQEADSDARRICTQALCSIYYLLKNTMFANQLA